MEQQESVKPSRQFIEIEAPAHLEFDQNFYDQPPFNSVFERVSKRERLEESVLRRMLTIYAQQYTHYRERALSDWSHEDAVSDAVGITMRSGRTRIPKDELLKHKETLSTLIDGLAEFPFWERYISNNLEDESHYDGTPLDRHFQIPTYARWATEEIGRQRKSEEIKKAAVIRGIEEIFPKDFGQDREAIPQTGRRRENRRWQILRASELIPEKK